MLSEGEDVRFNQIFFAYKTLHQMLRDRKYNITEEQLNMTRDQLKAKMMEDHQIEGGSG